MKIAIEIGSALHVLEVENGALDLSEYPSSGKEVLQGAYDAGDWAPYDPPELNSIPPEPNPKAFKIALMGDPLFLQWQEDIPAIRREDLKLAAIADNWPLVQLLYNHLKAMILTPEGATAQWQALAEAHAIPLEF